VNIPGAGGKKGNGASSARGMSARKKRVELLKEKVEKGTYRVNSKKVAEKLIEEALRMIRSRDGSE
jgi:anti-sigma28 factor (negative regulator of flagellin synthesis)